MRYETRVTAYDVMDTVWVSVSTTRTMPDDPDFREQVVLRRTTVQGTGESDPFQWTRDALIAALEAL